MNLHEVKAQMITGDKYKFVGTLVPPMLAIARVGDLPLLVTHINIGKKLGLVVYDPDLESETPYRAVDPKNFRAGSIQLENNTISLTESSTTFPENYPTEKEFTALLQGKISMLTID